MKILSVIPVMGIGGAESVASALVGDALSCGHSAQLASAGGFRADALVASGTPHIPLPLDSRRPRDLAKSVMALRRSVRVYGPDIIHAHNVKAAAVARAAAGRAVPIITTLHGVPDAALGASARILRRTSTVVVAVSPHVAEQLERHGFPQDRLVVIENSITPLERHPRDEARERLAVPEGSAAVLCLARMVPQKRHDLLIEGWAQAPAGSVLLLAGDGPTRPALEAQVRQLELIESVRFLGERTDADWLLAASDLMVLPTDWEGLPISLLEAMGVGVPVVVSRVGGVIETLGDAVRLVEPGSADAISAALRELLLDPAKRSALGSLGASRVAEHYAPAQMLNAYREVFATALDTQMTRSLG